MPRRRKARKTFVELVRETGSIARTRDLSKRRIATRRRRELAPTDPLAALAQLKAAGVRYGTSAQKLFDRHIVPALGSDQLLEEAIAVFGRELDALASRVVPSARSAAKKAAKHASSEYARIMGVRLPTTGVQTGAEAFAVHVAQAYRKIAADQTTELLLALRAGDPLEHKLWVTRNRTQTVAHVETERFFGAVYRMWTLRGGDEFSVWVTRRDEKVRESHRHREGVVFRTTEGLGGIQPGQEPGCRCKSIPASAELV